MKISKKDRILARLKALQSNAYENHGKVLRSVPAKKEWKVALKELEDDAIDFVEKLGAKRNALWAKIAKDMGVDTTKYGLSMNADEEVEVIEE